MEDQQPDPGDLTADPPKPAESPKNPVGKAARAKSQAGEQDSGESPDDAAPPEETREAGESQEAGESEEAQEVVLVPHRPAGRRLIAAVAVAATLFVGSAAFAGAMAQPYLSERALVQTKLDIAETATAAITTLWTYTPEDMPTLVDRASRYLSGDFAAEYSRYIDAIVETNKQAQVSNSTQVVGAAVESVSPPDIPSTATAIVYTNSVATSPVSKNIPSLRYLSYRLTMERDGGRWLITRMSTVTSFDLTPQL